MGRAPTAERTSLVRAALSEPTIAAQQLPLKLDGQDLGEFRLLG